MRIVPTRRRFLKTAGVTLVAAGTGPWFRRPADADLVIRGGVLYDGTGAPGVARDLAIAGGRITEIAAQLRTRGREEINARDLAVAPGFIDIHSHGDGSLDRDPRAESLIRQGLTTVIVGQDGGSATDLSEWAERMREIGPTVNLAAMIGLGSVRGEVVGEDDRPATPAELARMVQMVESALAAGACGASSGLEYTPGAFASREELVALCRPLAARQLPYATHMRNEDDHVLDAIDEAIAVAQGAGCPLEISHLKTQAPRNWGKLDQALARIEAARAAGLDIAFDRYPYIAYQTGLTNLFPVWSRDGGTDAFLARLADPSVAPRIRQETLAKVESLGGWHNVMVTSVRDSSDRGAEGRRVDEWAGGRDPYQATVDLLVRNRAGVGMVGFAMSEDNLERILAHPLSMICSDGGAYATEGPARRGSPHPRGLGTFPRVLGRYVRERRVLTLPQAIHKMSGFPASRLALRDRGRLAVGLAADVVVFDPATVADRATFENPFQYPVGITAVIVNGSVALRDGERGDRRTGKALGMRD